MMGATPPGVFRERTSGSLPALPPMVISMIAVGEQTGGLDEMLSKIADFYDEEVDAAVSGLLAMMEPLMIVFLGVVVGGMVVAMYLPIFDMINAVQWGPKDRRTDGPGRRPGPRSLPWITAWTASACPASRSSASAAS